MKKMLSLFFGMLLAIASTVGMMGCSNIDADKLNVPDYTQNGKRLAIAADVPLDLGDENVVKAYVDGGFNTLCMTEDYYDLDINRDGYFKALELLGKYNFDVYLRGNAVSVGGTIEHQNGNIKKENIEKCVLEEWSWDKVINYQNYERHTNYYEKYFGDVDFTKYPQIKGFYIVDEPTIGQLYELRANYVPWFNEKYANSGLEFVVNFLPPYAELGAGFGRDEKGNEWTYAECCEFFLKEVYDKVSAPNKMFGIDYYPLKSFSGVNTVDSGYLLGVLNASKYAYEYGMNPSSFIQCFGRNASAWRTPSCVADIKFQVYVNLAFGSKKITYYPFRGGYMGETGMYMQDESGYFVKTEIYDYVKSVNTELNKFGTVISEYDYKNVMTRVGTGSRLSYNDAFDLIRGQASQKFEAIDAYKSKFDSFMTEMEDSNGRKGYMLVNYDEPSIGRKNLVSINFDKEVKGLTVYRSGESAIVLLKDNQYQVELESGEGVFIIPLYKK